ncbi:hypothetical protein COCNU_11G007730 [Cocos nucifera]|uniref:C2HC zinc finger plants domain-containing protein n=1 Tax=Cocos nucifera TaxID=13894 RepID=A0A8K0IPD5_COCNU|nr:hypothetical protein COCNU_11G007730 [Cocos nucifera]
MDAMETDMTSGSGDMEEDDGGGPAAAAGHRVDAHQSAWSLLSLARQLIDQGKPSIALQTVHGVADEGVKGANCFPDEQAKLSGMTRFLSYSDWRSGKQIMAAMRSKGGEQAVFRTLNRARFLSYSDWRSGKQIMAAMRSKGGEQAVFRTLNRARELYKSKMQANAAVDELASLFAECAIAEAQPLRSDLPSPCAAVPSILIDGNDTSILAMSGRKQIMLDAFADGSSFVCLRCGGLVSNLRKEEHLAYWCGQV